MKVKIKKAELDKYLKAPTGMGYNFPDVLKVEAEPADPQKIEELGKVLLLRIRFNGGSGWVFENGDKFYELRDKVNEIIRHLNHPQG